MALRRRSNRRELSLAGMGFDLAASVGVAALIGWWIDGRYDTSPWGVVICSTIGIVGGLLNFVRAGQRAARASQRQAEQEAEESNGD